MTKQIEISFFNTIHLSGEELKEVNVLVKQNNKQSEEILLANEKHLSNQCRILFDALKRGERLTTGGALIQYRIGDLRRRVKDLRDAGIQVKDKLLENRFKEYFL